MSIFYEVFGVGKRTGIFHFLQRTVNILFYRLCVQKIIEKCISYYFRASSLVHQDVVGQFPAWALMYFPLRQESRSGNCFLYLLARPFSNEFKKFILYIYRYSFFLKIICYESVCFSYSDKSILNLYLIMFRNGLERFIVVCLLIIPSLYLLYILPYPSIILIIIQSLYCNYSISISLIVRYPTIEIKICEVNNITHLYLETSYNTKWIRQENKEGK